MRIDNEVDAKFLQRLEAVAAQQASAVELRRDLAEIGNAFLFQLAANSANLGRLSFFFSLCRSRSFQGKTEYESKNHHASGSDPKSHEIWLKIISFECSAST